MLPPPKTGLSAREDDARGNAEERRDDEEDRRKDHAHVGPRVEYPERQQSDDCDTEQYGRCNATNDGYREL